MVKVSRRSWAVFVESRFWVPMLSLLGRCGVCILLKHCGNDYSAIPAAAHVWDVEVIIERISIAAIRGSKRPRAIGFLIKLLAVQSHTTTL